MGINRLQLYNKTLLLCGERFLSALTEEREPRRLLDHVWDTGGVSACLEQAQWWFAMRTMRVEVDEDFTTPDFGYQYAFSKPEDWVSTSAVCSDEYFRSPLIRYSDEMGYWFADVEPIYVKIISNDDLYGNDLSRWPASFADYAAAYFASQIIGKLGGDRSKQTAYLLGPDGRPDRGYLATSLQQAKSAAAMTQPTQIPAPGSWVRARQRGRRSDGGSNSNLTG